MFRSSCLQNTATLRLLQWTWGGPLLGSVWRSGCTSASGSGPTKSMCTVLKRVFSVRKLPGLTCSCLLILTRWQTGQDLTNFLMSHTRPGQMYLSRVILMVCCWPACVSSCSAFIAACWYAGGSRRMARAATLGSFAFLNNRRGPPLFSAQEKSGVEASRYAAARVRWSSFWAAKAPSHPSVMDCQLAGWRRPCLLSLLPVGGKGRLRRC